MVGAGLRLFGYRGFGVAYFGEGVVYAQGERFVFRRADVFYGLYQRFVFVHLGDEGFAFRRFGDFVFFYARIKVAVKSGHLPAYGPLAPESGYEGG